MAMIGMWSPYKDQEALSSVFRLRTGSTGLLADQKRCMIRDERCVMCNSGEFGKYRLAGR